MSAFTTKEVKNEAKNTKSAIEKESDAAKSNEQNNENNNIDINVSQHVQWAIDNGILIHLMHWRLRILRLKLEKKNSKMIIMSQHNKNHYLANYL